MKRNWCLVQFVHRYCLNALDGPPQLLVVLFSFAINRGFIDDKYSKTLLNTDTVFMIIMSVDDG